MLGGRYRVIHRLGVGGMATVYLTRDHWRGRGVAVKVIAARRRQDPITLRRFKREAELAARLDHSNLVRVLDAGTYPQDFLVVHAEGVIHGDVSASNIMIRERDGIPKHG